MRLLFLVLLLANLVLAAWTRGVFGDVLDNGREPGRLTQQIEAERIRVLTDTDVKRLQTRAEPAPAASTPAPASAAAATAAAGCVEFGDFTVQAVANRARDRLAALNLGDRLASRSVQTAGWYMVYMPPMKSRADVDQRAEELRALGLRDLLVIADNSPMRFGIALGSFRDPELAKKHLADLERRGVAGARVAENPSTIAATRFQVSGIDAQTQQKLEALAKEFPQQKLQACTA